MAGDVYISFGADTGELEAAMAKANAEVRALGRELAQLAGEARKAGSDADSELGQKLSATASALAEAKGHVRDLKQEMRGVGEAAREGGEAQTVFDTIREAVTGALLPIRSLKSGLAEVAEVAAAAFAVDEIAEFVEHMAELGLETKKASEVLGVSTEDVGALSLVAKATGSSLEGLETQFARFARNLAEETKEAKRALDTLGLSFADLRGKPAVEQLGILADAFAKLPPGVERTAAAMEIFGRSGLQMLPMLAQGREGIEQWRRTAEETGTALSEGMVEEMEATHRAATTLGAAFEGLGVAIYDRFHGAIDGAIAVLTELVEGLTHAIGESGLFRETLDGLDVVLRAIEIGLALIVAGFESLYNAVGLAIGGVETLIGAFDRLIDDILPLGQMLNDLNEWAQKLGSGDIAGAAAALRDMASHKLFDFGKAKEDFGKALDDMGSQWNAYQERQRAAATGLDNALKGITGQQESHTEKIGKTSEAAVALRRRFDEVLDSIKGAGGGIDELTQKIETLSQGLAGVAAAGGGVGNGPALSAIGPTGSAEALIRHFEGFRSQAYWDVNAWRVGYGSDTTTDASGRVRRVQEGDTTTQRGRRARPRSAHRRIRLQGGRGGRRRLGQDFRPRPRLADLHGVQLRAPAVRRRRRPRRAATRAASPARSGLTSATTAASIRAGAPRKPATSRRST